MSSGAGGGGRGTKQPFATYDADDTQALGTMLWSRDYERAGDRSVGGSSPRSWRSGRPDRVGGVVLAATAAAPVTPAEAAHRRQTADRLERDGMLDVALVMEAGSSDRPRRNPDVVEPVLSMMFSHIPAGAAAALSGRAERPDYSALLAALQRRARGRRHPDASRTKRLSPSSGSGTAAAGRRPNGGRGDLPNLEAPAEFDAAVRSERLAELYGGGGHY